MSALILYNARLVDRDRDGPGALLVENGQIVAVCDGDCKNPELLFGDRAHNARTFDVQGCALMPSFIDLHTHFRDPGFTYKEDLESACQAAVAGGFGTVVCMANTNPVVSDTQAAFSVRQRAEKLGLLRLFQAVSATEGFDGKSTDHLDALDPCSVPLVSEDGKEVASARVMRDVMKKCAEKGVVLSCHCEDPDLADEAKEYRTRALEADAQDMESFFIDRGELSNDRRPKSGVLCSVPNSVSGPLAEAEHILRLAEDLMTGRNLTLAEETGCKVHFAHVSTSGALSLIRSAKLKNSQGASKVSCEVTPHHLSLTRDCVAIVNPPLRTEKDRLSLIEGLCDGTIDAIASDHAPHSLEDKQKGAPGFSGIQAVFPVCYTALVSNKRISLSRLSALLSANPASILGIQAGLIGPGYPADLVVVNTEGETLFEGQSWYSKSINSPYLGHRYAGQVVATFYQGKMVFAQ